MQRHRKILAALLLASGLLIAGSGLIFLIITATFGFDAPGMEHPAQIRRMSLGIAAILGVISAPALVAGCGLMFDRAWAIPVALVVCGLSLLNVPIGTALGVYGFWVLLDDRAHDEGVVSRSA